MPPLFNAIWTLALIWWTLDNIHAKWAWKRRARSAELKALGWEPRRLWEDGLRDL